MTQLTGKRVDEIYKELSYYNDNFPNVLEPDISPEELSAYHEVMNKRNKDKIMKTYGIRALGYE